MSKNNVKGALDDWGFDSPKVSVREEIRPFEDKAVKPESQKVGNSGNQKVGQRTLAKQTPIKVKKSDVQVVGKQENQETEDKRINQDIKEVFEMIDKVILKSKTFDLPPNLIRRIKMEAAASDKKEYQIALEAFEQYFAEKF
jgi:uncharacterized protein (UPF0335 family)